jgi:hypothetical protein
LKDKDKDKGKGKGKNKTVGRRPTLRTYGPLTRWGIPLPQTPYAAQSAASSRRRQLACDTMRRERWGEGEDGERKRRKGEEREKEI